MQPLDLLIQLRLVSLACGKVRPFFGKPLRHLQLPQCTSSCIGYSSDFWKRSTLTVNMTMPISAMATMSGQSTSSPTPLR